MTQRVETFTVAILDNANREPVGTGFIVAEKLIVTAYHVLVGALRLPSGTVLSSETRVRVRFPFAHIEKDAVVTEYTSIDADIAILRVAELPGSHGIAVLGSSTDCAGDRFVSVGYRAISGGAVGTIAPPELEPTRAPYPRLVLRSDQIDKGMSGAPVLDLDQDRVVGMVVSTWYGESASGKDRETSFAAPAEAIKQICGLLSLVEPPIEVSYAVVRPKGTILENLPSRRTRHFVGRIDQKQEILNFLKDEGANVVISGAGGMGKTTLAIEIAHYCLEERFFGATIWTTTEFKSELPLGKLLDTISEVFGFDAYRKLDKADKVLRVRRLLRAEPCLLIVDGFETIVDPEVFDFIRARPRQCRLLTTTRNLIEALEGENIALRELNRWESEELMCARSSGKRLENASPDVFRDLHNACGGMPLALEWAIGQINAGRQTLQNVVNNLSQAKVKALYESLFESSYDSLTGTEKQVLGAITVSIGTVSKKTLGYVVELGEDEVGKSLKQLIDLFLVYENGEFEEEKVRFSIHPLLQNFVQAKLDQQPAAFAERLVERYIRYFSDLAERSEYEAFNLDDMRFVLDWCSQHNPKRLVQLVYALSYFFFNYGLWEERIERAHQAIDASRALADAKAEAWMLINELGYMSIQLGNHSAADAYIQDGLRMVREKIAMMGKNEIATDAEDKLGFQFMMGLALRYLGILSSNRSNYSDADKYFAESLRIFESLKRESIIANQKIEMAEFALRRGDTETALSLYHKSLEYHSKQKDAKPWVLPWMARAYYGLGDIRSQKGELDKARSLYMTALNLVNIRHDEYEIAQTNYRLALIEEKERNYESAMKLSQDALRVFARLGTVRLVDQVEGTIVRVQHQQMGY